MTDAIIEALDQEIARCRRRLEALERSRALLLEEGPEAAAQMLVASPAATPDAPRKERGRAGPLCAKCGATDPRLFGTNAYRCKSCTRAITRAYYHRAKAALELSKAAPHAPPVDGAEELLDATPVAASAADESDHEEAPAVAKPFDRAKLAGGTPRKELLLARHAARRGDPMARLPVEPDDD